MHLDRVLEFTQKCILLMKGMGRLELIGIKLFYHIEHIVKNKKEKLKCR